MNEKPCFVLASKSPRRRQILVDNGFEFIVDPPLAEDERMSFPCEIAPSAIAMAKAFDVASRRNAGELIVAVDTLVFLDGQPLGKPGHSREAVEYLQALSGKRHIVVSGVCILRRIDHLLCRFCESTAVLFKKLDAEVIREYLRGVHTLDKAGGYAIQECGELIIESVEGSMSNVIGLPIERFQDAMRHVGKHK